MDGPVVWGNEATKPSTKRRVGRAVTSCLILLDMVLVAAGVAVAIAFAAPWWLCIIIGTVVLLIFAFIGWCVGTFLNQILE